MKLKWERGSGLGSPATGWEREEGEEGTVWSQAFTLPEKEGSTFWSGGPFRKPGVPVGVPDVVVEVWPSVERGWIVEVFGPDSKSLRRTEARARKLRSFDEGSVGEVEGDRVRSFALADFPGRAEAFRAAHWVLPGAESWHAQAVATAEYVERVTPARANKTKKRRRRRTARKSRRRNGR